MLMGLFLLYQTVGTLEINLLKEACQAVENKVPLYWSAALMLVGFGGKAGMFPLHVWLPKAHPVAPAPASALLSGVLTKTGVYGILIICANIFFGDKLWGSVGNWGCNHVFGGVFSIVLSRFKKDIGLLLNVTDWIYFGGKFYAVYSLSQGVYHTLPLYGSTWSFAAYDESFAD